MRAFYGTTSGLGNHLVKSEDPAGGGSAKLSLVLPIG